VTITDFMALVLAVLAMLRVWFLGSIFQRQRAYYEALDNWRGKLMSCVLCLSFHATLLLTLGLVVPAILLPAPWSLLPQIPLYALAATTVVYWLWQLERRYLHTPVEVPDRISPNSDEP
jgi:hypothetical protein